MPRPEPTSSPEAALSTTTRMGWRSVRSWRAAIGICAAALAVVVEAWHFTVDPSPELRLGGVPLSPAIAPVFVMILVGGQRLVGRPRSTDAAKVFWALLIMATSIVVAAVDGTDLDHAGGLVLAALSEELVYRVAAPALAALGLARIGMPYRHALTTGYVVAGVVFIGLPGHVAQWVHWADAIPFAAFAVLATLAVHRSGAVLEIGLLHSLMNIVNIGRLRGDIGTPGAVMLAGLLALLVIGYIPSARTIHPARTRRSESDVVIDLTGATPAVIVEGHLDPVGIDRRRGGNEAHDPERGRHGTSGSGAGVDGRSVNPAPGADEPAPPEAQRPDRAHR